MKAVAGFAVRRRWLVVIGWIVLIVAAQGIAGALGGSAYKDTYSLPNTETATVASLLKQAGLSNQNGVSGTVVLKKTDNSAFTGPPGGLLRRVALQPVELDQLCNPRRPGEG